MSTPSFDINNFVDAFQAHDDLVSPTLAIGLVSGVALLPKELSPSEWFNLLWCGDEPTVNDANIIHPAFEQAIALYQWVLSNPTELLVEHLAAIDINEFSMGCAMALNWGQDTWNEVGLENDSDSDHLIGALMLVCVTLAWPEDQRPEGVSLPSNQRAEEQLLTAISAVKQISAEFRAAQAADEEIH